MTQVQTLLGGSLYSAMHELTSETYSLRVGTTELGEVHRDHVSALINSPWACLTGSRVFGCWRPDSDWDFILPLAVISPHIVSLHVLRQFDPRADVHPSPGFMLVGSDRRLNIIAALDQVQYSRWLLVHSDMMALLAYDATARQLVHDKRWRVQAFKDFRERRGLTDQKHGEKWDTGE